MMRNTVMQGDIEMTEPIGAIRVTEAPAAAGPGRHGARRLRTLTAWLLYAGTAALMAGCATSTPSGSLTRFDLGPPTMPVTSAAANAGNATNVTAPASDVMASGASRMPPLKVVVNAPSWLDADVIYYRLPASDGDQARVYANSRWLAPPSRLFGDRLRAALSVDRPVLAAGDPTAAPALRVELEEFAQYFDSTSVSRGVVQVRATLFDGPKLLAQTTLRAQAPAASADAAGGARALAVASDAVQTQLIQWLAGRVPAPPATTRAPAQSRALRAAPSASGATTPAR
ncbi:ABC transporter [Pandoraea communis]|uniref:ABC transporter n=2 Tax=Pandoraea communis TaxID=2508297 RepID=A0A5E4RSZ8_9BURK|nr:ABC transporter [Pandoraea communis]